VYDTTHLAHDANAMRSFLPFVCAGCVGEKCRRWNSLLHGNWRILLRTCLTKLQKSKLQGKNKIKRQKGQCEQNDLCFSSGSLRYCEKKQSTDDTLDVTRVLLAVQSWLLSLSLYSFACRCGYVSTAQVRINIVIEDSMCVCVWKKIFYPLSRCLHTGQQPFDCNQVSTQVS
jgi:hypothetical protein